MKNNELGLPLEYNELDQYFDVLKPSVDKTDVKNSVIEDILKHQQVTSVLDLSCGTGSQVFWLVQHGYAVTGADISPALLARARKRAEQENVDVQLIEGDMRTLTIGLFDAVITIDNAIGHLTKAGFEQALKNIHGNLKDEGVYVFDIFNFDAMTDDVVKSLSMDLYRTVGNTTIHNVQHSTFDRGNGLLTSTDTFIVQEGEDKPQVVTGEFSLQLYTVHQLRDMLTRNGFEIVRQYEVDKATLLEGSPLSILTIAKKV